MANIIRHLHRLAGGAGAGSPATVSSSGVVAINFDVGVGTPELWASNGTAWKQLNPATTVTHSTSAQVITGTDTTTVIDPAGLAGASVVISAGAADAGKYVRVDAAGLIDDTVVPKATAADILTGTATDLFITPAELMADATATSAGVADAGKFVLYDSNGKLDTSVFTYATSAEIITGTDTAKLFNASVMAGAATVSSAGVADAGKYVRLDANGKIDSSILNLDAMEYKGGVDVTAAAPAATKGDVYIVTTGGTIAASFTGIAGATATAGDQLIYDGAAWQRVAGATDTSAYLPLAGTAGVAGAAMTSGAVIKMNPAAAGNTVLDAALGAIDNATIDCGTF